MKLSIGFYITIVVLCIVLFMTLSASCYNVVPYSSDSLFLNQSAYEGFHGMKPVNYSTYPNNQAIDMKDRYNIAEPKGDSNKKVQRIWGFDGLFGSAELSDNSLDIYSLAKSDLACGNRSSGLSNSRGYLCLDENQTKMLTTRGGNMSSGDAQIGK